MLECVTKAQSIEPQLHRIIAFILVAHDEVLIPVIVRRTFSIHCLVRVFVIAHVVATSLPLMRLVLLVLLRRVDEGLHADLVATVILLQVVDVKTNGMALADVSHREEEPL